MVRVGDARDKVGVGREDIERESHALERGGSGGGQRTMMPVTECGERGGAESDGSKAGEAKSRGRRSGINETGRDRGIRDGIMCRVFGQ